MGTASDSFWNIQTSGVPDPESGADDTGGMIGISVSEMFNKSTFTDAGWDFSIDDGNEPVWYLYGDNYP